MADSSPLRIRATLDPSTGAITCDNAGANFDGDIRCEFHPDVEQNSREGHEAGSHGVKGRGTGQADQGGSGLAGSAGGATRTAPIGSFASAPGTTATDADVTGARGSDAPEGSGLDGQCSASAASGDGGSLEQLARTGPAPIQGQARSAPNPGVPVRLPDGETISDPNSQTGKLMSPVADLSPVAAAAAKPERYFDRC
jgi:hypothetical protein